jgi:hypothetical protein
MSIKIGWFNVNPTQRAVPNSDERHVLTVIGTYEQLKKLFIAFPEFSAPPKRLLACFCQKLFT